MGLRSMDSQILKKTFNFSEYKMYIHGWDKVGKQEKFHSCKSLYYFCFHLSITITKFFKYSIYI